MRTQLKIPTLLCMLEQTQMRLLEWQVPKRDDFNSGAIFEGNVGSMVDSHVSSMIDNNVKEVKSIVKKLQKSECFESEIKTLM